MLPETPPKAMNNPSFPDVILVSPFYSGNLSLGENVKSLK